VRSTHYLLPVTPPPSQKITHNNLPSDIYNTTALWACASKSIFFLWFSY
jgi:hypothetical protein